MKIGDTVLHPRWGRGVILAVENRPRGVFAKIRFGYATDWISAVELPGGESLRASLPDKPVSAGSADQPTASRTPLPRARAAVQALKLGQMLETEVERMSVGTSQQEAAFEEAFDRARYRRPQLIMVEGAWGVGKTHLLALLGAHARKREFAASTTILDGCAATLADPMRLLESVTSAIRFPQQTVPMGVGNTLAEVKRRGMLELRSLGGPRIVQVMEQIPREALDDPEVIVVLEDYLGLSLAAGAAKERLRRLGWPNVLLPPLKARSIEERGDRMAELLGDWAAFCVASGAKGLLVVFDEMDVDYARAPWWNYDRRSRQDSALAALGKLHRRDIPLVIAFGSAPAGAGEDENVDAVRDVINKLGAVDVHEKAVQLSEPQLRELGERVFRLYAEAYPGVDSKLSSAQVAAIIASLLSAYERELSPVPRRFVRSWLHCLDLIDLDVVTPSSVLEGVR